MAVCVTSTGSAPNHHNLPSVAEQNRKVNGRTPVRFVLDRERYAALKRYCDARDTYPTALIEAIGQCWIEAEQAGQQDQPCQEENILETARRIAAVNLSRKPKPAG